MHFKSTLIRYLQQFVNYLQGTRSPTPSVFDDLSPIDNVKNIENYDQALSWAIANPRIRNIAVTGPYGSGKSSLLKTFEKRHPGHHYLNVSLASFQDDKEPLQGEDLPAGTNSPEEMHRLIELSILQQMFYRVRNATIPDSRFNRIKNLSSGRILALSIYTAAFFIAFTVLFFPSFFNRISWWLVWSKNHSDWVFFLAILLALPALYKVQTYVLRILNTSRFNKINLSKGEVEFDEKSESSVLNKHLDEILYFFEVTDYDIVVFEDLDRFNDPEIFTKLREINILVNQSLQIGRRVVFIYAIKDDMFKDKTRTKFFDFIIPVIPVINNSNSYEIMSRKFRNPDLKLEVTDRFISAITLYVDDMRALKNIFNEFMLYKENLKGIDLIQDKLLAIIVYKNIFPSDFADLHENKGVIYNVFDKKPALIKATIERKEKAIAQNNSRLADFEVPFVANTLELRSVYLLAFQKLVPHAIGLVINGGELSFTAVQNNDEYFDQFRASSNIRIFHYIHSPYYGQGYFQKQQPDSGISFQQVENAVDSKVTYQDRYNLLAGMKIAEVEKLVEANKAIQEEISKVKSASLKELFDETPEIINELSVEFIGKKLLLYLVREGYLDETYPSLVSYFYEGSLSFKDMNFILSVRNREALPFDYKLNNHQNILKRMDIEDFSREQVLNFQLISALLSTPKTYVKQLHALYALLCNKQPQTLKFIDEYIDKGEQKEEFFKQLFDAWPKFWDSACDELNLNATQKTRYLMAVVTYGSIEQIKKLNQSEALEKSIKADPFFLNHFTSDAIELKVKEVIKSLNLKFYKLAPQEPTSTLLDFVIAGQYYMLTEDMISLIIHENGATSAKDDELLKTANYTAIQLSDFGPLITYVEDNLPEYLETITLLSPTNAKDSKQCVITLLNNENLDIGIKDRLIDKEEVTLEDISKVPEQLWAKLFDAGKVAASWSNIIRYFQKTETMDDHIISYLNREPMYKTLGSFKSNSDTSFNQAVHSKVAEAYLLAKDLSDQAYEHLANSAPYYYPEGLAVEQLSEKKVTVLIERRTIGLVAPTFTLLKAHFSHLVGKLIEKNLEGYLKSPASFELTAEDFVFLFKSPNVTPAQKNSLMPLISNELLEANTSLSDLYAKQRLEHNTQQVLENSTLKILIQHGSLLTRRQLVDKYYEILSLDDVTACLTALGVDFALVKPDGESFDIDGVTSLEISLVRKLKNSGLIQDFKSKKDSLTITNLKSENNS